MSDVTALTLDEQLRQLERERRLLIAFLVGKVLMQHGVAPPDRERWWRIVDLLCPNLQKLAAERDRWAKTTVRAYGTARQIAQLSDDLLRQLASLDKFHRRFLEFLMNASLTETTATIEGLQRVAKDLVDGQPKGKRKRPLTEVGLRSRVLSMELDEAGVSDAWQRSQIIADLLRVAGHSSSPRGKLTRSIYDRLRRQS